MAYDPRSGRETLPYVRDYPNALPPVEVTPSPGGEISTISRPVAVTSLAPPVSQPATGFQFTGTQLLIGAAVLYFLFSKK